jgi:predicted metal-dependent phosphotriesterase family hydrolase
MTRGHGGIIAVWDPRTYEDTDYGLDPGESFEPDDYVEEEVDLTGPHVMTVLGSIHPDELGVCLHRERLLSSPAFPTPGDPDLVLDDEARATEELEAFITMSGRTVVDCTTRDVGRNAAGLVRIAGVVPMYILGVTGRHTHEHAERMTNALDVDALTAEFLADLQHGMDGTEARAGVIMVGTGSSAPTDVEAATIIAAGASHRLTGAPVSTFSQGAPSARIQLDRLAHAGVEPGSVILGNLDRQPVWNDMVAIARSGAFLSVDQVGKAGLLSDTERASLLVRLADAGFADQLLVSQDTTRRSEMLAYGGSPGLAYLMERFTLELMHAGADAPLVRTILVDNPARALTINPPQSPAT